MSTNVETKAYQLGKGGGIDFMKWEVLKAPQFDGAVSSNITHCLNGCILAMSCMNEFNDEFQQVP